MHGLTVVVVSVALALLASDSNAQTRPTRHITLAAALTRTRPVTATAAIAALIAGKYTYRSYVNRPDVVVNDDAQSATKALSLLFGEGVMTLDSPVGDKVTGTFDMGGGYVLDLSGTIETGTSGLTVVKLAGPGRPGTLTAGWEYDYQAIVTPSWATATGQIPALVGTVLRAKPHGSAKAGVTASFIAVKHI